MRIILQSRVYQLGSLPNDTNKADARNYSRSNRRRLPAEVLLDAVSAVTETRETFAGLSGAPRSRLERQAGERLPGCLRPPQFQRRMPLRTRRQPTVVQALHLMNSSKLQERLTDQKAASRGSPRAR